MPQTGSIRQFESATEAHGAFAPQPFPLPEDRPHWGRDREVDVQHIRLEFAFDLRAKRVDGVTTTTFRPLNDGLREVTFDAIELDVAAVTDDAGRPLSFVNDGRYLRVDLGRARTSRRAITTVVRYSCRPRRGLYFNEPDAAYPDRPRQVWTQGQAEDSAAYFPCFDYPGEKATTEVFATVPDGWFVLSNGALQGAAEDRRRRTTTYHWKQDRPHPAYLVTLVAGELAAVEEDENDAGIPIEYYGPHGTEDALRRAFGRTPEMVAFFASKVAPYPWAKYATVAVHDFIFGGMENTSATTMTDTLLHDERAHQDVAEQCDSITAHELAHQWFGDLLTCREWAHGWLNESFATYFDALFTEHHRGWDAFRYQLLQNARLYLDEDGRRYRRPLVQHVYSEPIDIFDRHLYERGSLVLDMLRFVLGDDLWWKAIRHYVATHAEGDVLTHDLQRAIEAATGRNVDWFFDQWVWKGGHPEFKAGYRWDRERRVATISLEQRQQPDEHLTAVFRTPLELGFMTARGYERRRVEVTDAQHTFVVPLDAEPRFVSIDPANRILKTIEFEPGEAMLRAQLAEDPEAMGRVSAAAALAKLASPAAVDALRTALLNADELDTVRAEVATALGTARTEAARDALIAAAGAQSSRVRRAVAAALGKFPEDPTAARALTSYLAGRGDDSYYVQAAAAQALGETRDPSAFAALRRALGRTAHNDVITAGALTGLGLLRDPRGAALLIEWTAWGRHQNARRAATEALGRIALHMERGVREQIRERLERLLDDRWLRVQLAAVAALEVMGDPQAIPALRRCADRALDGRLRRSAKVAARTIAGAADRGASVKQLQDDVERLHLENRQLKERLTTIEAAVQVPAATSGHRGQPAVTPPARTARRGRQP